MVCAGQAEVKAAYRLLDYEELDWRRAVLEAHGVPDSGADGAGGSGLVHPGHDGTGLHQPAGNRGVGPANL